VAARFLSSRDQITQSGKIVRRIIQSVSEGEEIGDLSSIENPEALDEIAEAR